MCTQNKETISTSDEAGSKPTSTIKSPAGNDTLSFSMPDLLSVLKSPEKNSNLAHTDHLKKRPYKLTPITFQSPPLPTEPTCTLTTPNATVHSLQVPTPDMQAYQDSIQELASVSHDQIDRQSSLTRTATPPAPGDSPDREENSELNADEIDLTLVEQLLASPIDSVNQHP